MSGPEDQHPWEREDEEIREAFAAKDAEIERLKKIIAHYKSRKLESLIAELIKLIEELPIYEGDDDIMKRAREATK
jgi:hypothetical protein